MFFFSSLSAFRVLKSLNLIGLACIAAVYFPSSGEIDVAEQRRSAPGLSKKLWRSGRGWGRIKGEVWVFLALFRSFRLLRVLFFDKERKRLLRRLNWLIACNPAVLICLSEPWVRTAPKFPALATFKLFACYTVKQRTIETFITQSQTNSANSFAFFARLEMSNACVRL